MPNLVACLHYQCAIRILCCLRLQGCANPHYASHLESTTTTIAARHQVVDQKQREELIAPRSSFENPQGAHNPHQLDHSDRGGILLLIS